MKSRDNIDKIKTICSELGDRDSQLKINASTLWVILDKVDITAELVTSILNSKDCTVAASYMLNDVLKNLEHIRGEATNRGCKKVKKHV